MMGVVDECKTEIPDNVYIKLSNSIKCLRDNFPKFVRVTYKYVRATSYCDEEGETFAQLVTDNHSAICKVTDNVSDMYDCLPERLLHGVHGALVFWFVCPLFTGAMACEF